MDGNIVNDLNRNVVPLGDIVKNGTIKKLAEKFKIKSKVKIFSLIIYKNYSFILSSNFCLQWFRVDNKISSKLI